MTTFETTTAWNPTPTHPASGGIGSRIAERLATAGAALRARHGCAAG
jgi:hypothetical protein